MKPIIAVPATLALVYRAYSKKSLTPAGIVAAALTAVAHAIHPWNLPFVLLTVFFLAGTRVTHIKENVKATLTLPSSGPRGGGEGPRTHVQVFANSLVASVLTLLHAFQLYCRNQAMASLAAAQRDATASTPLPAKLPGSFCFAWGSGDLLVIGIIANYACVAADTFSSELGILSRETPRLITSPTLRKVPRGTNGGVTLSGLAAGLLGSMIVVTVSMLFLPMCSEGLPNAWFGGLVLNPEDGTVAISNAAHALWSVTQRRQLMVALTLWGLLGSVLDSVLGGLLQRSVRDVRSGKIVEGEGGVQVMISEQAHQHMHGPLDDIKDEAAVANEGDDGTEAIAEKKEEKKEKTEKKKDNEDRETTSIQDKESTPQERYDVHNQHRRPSFGNYQPSRVVENGWNVLDNNDVNFLMAFTMSMGAMGVAAWYWGVPFQGIMEA